MIKHFSLRSGRANNALNTFPNTSGTMSPTFKKGVGMAMVNIDNAFLENEIHIKIREKLYKGKIVKKPIYAFNGKNNGDKNGKSI